MTFDPFRAYRKLFTSLEDGIVCWWYFGTAFAAVEGYPEIPVTQAETVMAYRTTTLGPDAFRVEWWEIGYFRDPITGEPHTTWRNPFTGAEVRAPQKFEEGPAHYTVSRANDGGVTLELAQAHAKVIRIGVEVSQRNGQVFLDQLEEKVRGFPLPDGSLPDPDSPNASKARTSLWMLGRADEVADETPSASGTGAYSFSLASPPAWMGFGDMPGSSIVRGVMHKAPLDAPLNPLAWTRLQTIFPDRFDGDRIQPVWYDRG